VAAWWGEFELTWGEIIHKGHSFWKRERTEGGHGKKEQVRRTQKTRKSEKDFESWYVNGADVKKTGKHASHKENRAGTWTFLYPKMGIKDEKEIG